MDKNFEIEISELFGKIYDYIIDKYLKPNGIESFHLGLDEVRCENSHDPDDMLKVFSPFCECPECSKLTNQEKSSLLEYSGYAAA